MSVRVVLGLLAMAIVLVLPGSAMATRGLATGFLDPQFWSSDPVIRDQALASAKDENATYARTVVRWDYSVVSEPTNPTDPNDPSYRFATTDRTVDAALAHGLKPILLITGAPDWAEGANRDPNAEAGTWKPDPGDTADFVAAVAARYPDVRYIQLWNEPNLHGNLMPQWEHGRNFAATHYQKMVNASDAALKSIGSNDRLITGGLAPYGDDPGGKRTRPLTFLRNFLCLNRKLKRSCKRAVHFDILGVHAFNPSASPYAHAFDKDDLNPVDLPKAKKALRAAERRGTAPGKHLFWVTESWWETNPPEKHRFTLAQQKRYILETMYLSWKAGASAMIYLRIRDSGVAVMGDTGAEGLYFVDGTPKPSAAAFAFPFVAERARRGKKLTLWGIAPSAGDVVVEMKAGSNWKTIKRIPAGSSTTFTAKAAIRGKAKLRARAGGSASPVWDLKK